MCVDQHSAEFILHSGHCEAEAVCFSHKAVHYVVVTVFMRYRILARVPASCFAANCPAAAPVAAVGVRWADSDEKRRT